MSLVLAALVAVLFSVGTYLVLQRTLTRIILGVGIMGHAANLLLLTAGGRAGVAPFVGRGDSATFVDPLPQALALTAIVISFGLMAFLLALAYRSFVLTGQDEVEDDIEDRRIGRLRDETDDDLDALHREVWEDEAT